VKEDLELDSFEKYSKEGVYDSKTITKSLLKIEGDYSSLLLQAKAETLFRYVNGGRVVDLGCGNGRHLIEIANRISQGIGLDFSLPFIREARNETGKYFNIDFIVCDARKMPISSNSIDSVYSFATIYHINDITTLYNELARMLVAGGMAVIEIGNAKSINTLMMRQEKYADFAQHSRRTRREHLETLEASGFKIVSQRSFQLLPMWGDPPKYLRWTRHSCLEKIMKGKFKNRMIDEWISSLPVARSFAFRHLLVCQKQ
jgi:ubiquinone/menaquinone biosynthesis C-methylase UbiE